MLARERVPGLALEAALDCRRLRRSRQRKLVVRRAAAERGEPERAREEAPEQGPPPQALAVRLPGQQRRAEHSQLRSQARCTIASACTCAQGEELQGGTEFRRYRGETAHLALM